LYLSSPFLRDGHSHEKANGTITYIKFRGEIYGVTCAHVYYEQTASGKVLTLHGKDRYILHLGALTPMGYQSSFRPLRRENESDGTDVAVISFGKGEAQYHLSRKNKSPIDLDSWTEPEWPEIRVPIAFGYPTEHKVQSGKYLQAPLVSVAAELTRALTESDESFLMASSLAEDNRYYFSGMSGGPVYHLLDATAEPIPIGIVFEGSPGSSAEWNARDSQAFLTKCDIQIKAHTLTPAIFEGWLRRIGFA